jgi:hypothetical protein
LRSKTTPPPTPTPTISTNIEDQRDSVALGVLLGFSIIGITFIVFALFLIWRKSSSSNGNHPNSNQYVTFADNLGSRSTFHYSDLEHDANERDAAAAATAAESNANNSAGYSSFNQRMGTRASAATTTTTTRPVVDEFFNQAFDLQENGLSQQTTNTAIAPSGNNRNLKFDPFDDLRVNQNNNESNL